MVAEDAPRLAISQIGQARDHQQRKRQRAELRIADHIGHRREQLRLDPLEGEQREIGGDDDQGGEEDRPRNLQRGIARVVYGERLVRLGLATPQDGVGHDDGAVHDDPEIDGAKRQEIGRDVREMHHDEGYRHRERNGDAHDQRAARAAEKHDENDEDEANSHEYGVRNLVDRRIDQVRPVDIGHDLHALRFQAVIELGHLGMDAVHDTRWVFAAQQEDDAFDDVIPFVIAKDAVALLIAQLQLAEVPHEDRRSVALCDHDVAHVIECLDEANSPHDVAEVSPRQNAAAGLVRSDRKWADRNNLTIAVARGAFGERSVDDMLQVWLDIVYMDDAEFNRLVEERKTKVAGR